MEETTVEIFEKVKSSLPKDVISDIRFEGCEIVIYTKNKDFFVDSGEHIKKLVNSIKKRVVLRPDPALCLQPEQAKIIIEKIVPKEAGLKDIYFEPEFGKVILEVEKLGLAIGKGGELLKEIKKQTFWSPVIDRASVIPSDVVKTLRELIHKESFFRKDFLDKIGRRIHGGWKGTDWIRLTALGGFREVGRSALLLQTPESRVLLDCGIKPGSNEYPYLSVPEFNIQALDAIVLSHAHLDHCGMIPYLYEYGFNGPLYCTAPTRDVMVLLCLDFIEIMQKEGKQTPYTSKGIKESVRHSVCLEYDEVSDITPDTRLTLENAGHILGSSVAHIHIGEGMHNVLYTGDIKFDRTALFEPASTAFQRVETIITESTYGLQEDIQPPRREAEANLMENVNKIMKKRGKVLVPTFAVERAQDIMVILVENNFEYPVFLEGMLWDALAIHTTYPEYLNRELQKMIFHKGFNPFTAEIFKRVGSVDERKTVLESKEPCVILATSGMLVGGPAIEYLKALAENKNNALLFVSYQAEGTLGKRIQKGWREIPMEVNGRNVALPINCEVMTVDGLSGHSDHKQLINYIYRLNQKPERIITNHGDNNKCIELAKTMHKTFRCETLAPKLLETVRLK